MLCGLRDLTFCLCSVYPAQAEQTARTQAECKQEAIHETHIISVKYGTKCPYLAKL